MLPYWLLFAIFALGALLFQRQGAEKQNPLLIAAGCSVALMIGLRYEVGGDWETYYRIFTSIYYMDVWQALAYSDPGYSLLNWVTGRLKADIWLVNLVCGTIFTWGLFRFARQQPNPWLAVLVAAPYLVIVVAMGYTRQAAAIGFVLAGLASLDRSSLARFGIYVLFAVLFHKSAIVVMPLVALSAARNKLVIYLLLLLLTISLYYVFLAADIETVVQNYVEAGYDAQGAGIRAAMNVPPALIYLLFHKHFELGPVQHKLWRNLSWASLLTIAVLIAVDATTIVDRLALYLIPLQIFVLSRVPYVFRGRGVRNSQLLVAIILYSALIQAVWLNFATHAHYWLPYQFFPTADKAAYF